MPKKRVIALFILMGSLGLNKDPGLLQNFMTVAETKFIDKIIRFDNVQGAAIRF